ncbi:acyl-CoA reductase-like NAD-dependent aldehyde dehydrogenase [Melghirimyces profundicolus]|uniref:Aldehyde dehydrogenase n=1 Tax=Melghirimyces profundicolus TaxID=1242148 RepID=A0A2T6BQF5_9BACL|nr:aldehyde dehydrogenase family protein [Melghirimyces profundicolus]PTX58333.1 acyl-CoA reductase-like NAD-dependent aldehyde dehydrogenase [Melghirimyces profundicolus]
MSVLEMMNPATAEKLGEVREATKEDVQTAMAEAREAFSSWRNVPLKERLRFMKRLRETIVEQADDLADQIAKDTGKVKLEALMSDIFPTVATIKYYEGKAASILKTRRVRTPVTLIGRRSRVEYRPMGVVAVISPWNYPFQLSVIPAVSALITGNTVLYKPSEISPLTGKVIEDLFSSLAMPKGVFRVLHGGKETGRHLVESGPDKIFFTGSAATGKKIMAAAAERLIPVELELGGKDPMLVFADADLDRAAYGAIWGAFTNAGQTCMAVERLYVESTVYADFVKKVKEKAEKLRLDQPDENDIGSMTSPQQMEIVNNHLEDAVEKGARVLCGGRRLNGKTLHFEPTVLIDVDHSMKIMRDETFGPVLPIMPFSSEEEAVRLANETPYGLNASVWSRDMAKANRVAARIDSGNVCINDVMIGIANPHLPYGGNKESGMGRYHGPEGLLTFVHPTSVISHPGKKRRELNWFPYNRDQYEAIGSLIRLLYGGRPARGLKGLPKVAKEFFRSE